MSAQIHQNPILEAAKRIPLNFNRPSNSPCWLQSLWPSSPILQPCRPAEPAGASAPPAPAPASLRPPSWKPSNCKTPQWCCGSAPCTGRSAVVVAVVGRQSVGNKAKVDAPVWGASCCSASARAVNALCAKQQVAAFQHTRKIWLAALDLPRVPSSPCFVGMFLASGGQCAHNRGPWHVVVSFQHPLGCAVLAGCRAKALQRCARDGTASLARLLVLAALEGPARGAAAPRAAGVAGAAIARTRGAVLAPWGMTAAGELAHTVAQALASRPYRILDGGLAARAAAVWATAPAAVVGGAPATAQVARAAGAACHNGG